MGAFATFVLHQLPPPPRRILEVGCGHEGGLVEGLVAAGYDAVGVDPHAPEGVHFSRVEFQSVEDAYDAAVAGRVLHHVRPLDASLDHLTGLAPLLIVDEFAWDLIDEPAQEWYEERHRVLTAAGSAPPGWARFDEWRERHNDLHPHGLVLDALRERYEERTLEWVPYLHRWLGEPDGEARERSLIDAGAIPAIGWRWAGVRR